jgi:uncharacterized protein YdiU (UPF0061 family)
MLKVIMLNFDNTFIQLPENFYEKVSPDQFSAPELIAFNEEFALELGMEPPFDHKELAQYFAGQKLFTGSEPLAKAYAGHQFGNFVPQLGDGRAVLLGEIVTKNKRYDIQLKGAGQTRFSRRGDGRSALGPVLREYLVSEAMQALNIATTRALAAVSTGEKVMRETPLPGGVFTRIASSHIRVGTFEYHFHRGDMNNLKVLADYTIKRHYPEVLAQEDTYFEFFKAVAKRKLKLVAQWMGVGFIHGVMNTDNTSIAGETIDFGPCAFMDHYVANKVYSSIDRMGRYAYNNQAPIALWNLSSFASCLVHLMPGNLEKNIALLQEYFLQLEKDSQNYWLEVMSKKLGISNPINADKKLIELFLQHLETNHLDFTNSFRAIPQMLESNEEVFLAIHKRLEQESTSREEQIHLMNVSNPYLIPRNHQVEKAIEMGLHGNYDYFHYLNKAYKNPFQEQKELEDLTLPPRPEEIVHQTFCGT